MLAAAVEAAVSRQDTSCQIAGNSMQGASLLAGAPGGRPDARQCGRSFRSARSVEACLCSIFHYAEASAVKHRGQNRGPDPTNRGATPAPRRCSASPAQIMDLRNEAADAMYGPFAQASARSALAQLDMRGLFPLGLWCPVIPPAGDI
jgi:hypothetical protein